MFEILNNLGGIIVAIIASFTAFKLYNHKQAQTKKYEAYESICESFNKLNDISLHAYETCNNFYVYNNFESEKINRASQNIFNAKAEILAKRHLVYLYTSPSFTNEFKRFEKKLSETEEERQKLLNYLITNEYNPVDDIDNIVSEATKLHLLAEYIITKTRNIIDHDLNKK